VTRTNTRVRRYSSNLPEGRDQWTKIALPVKPEMSVARLQEGIGRFTGDAKTRAEGIANQVSGTVQDIYGQARDNASELARDMKPVARQAVSNIETALRDSIEAQPFTSVLVAFGIGWLLGRMRHWM
jgi:uncharacterized protein YjbJ (UPF0337 family)